MRTLATQMRLRRTTMTFRDRLERVREDPSDRDCALAARSALLKDLAALREIWELEAQVPGGLEPLLEGHFHVSLARLEALAAQIAQPGVGLARLGVDFLGVAVPLSFYLRGLEQVGDEHLFRTGSRLARSA
ncbi:MAG TPA: hypothetical protein VG015_05675 [Candidatus Dormibacteraeota bacterium]|nr:hypothetical protein [Candidatus Dormibacteraeota bacterium]